MSEKDKQTASLLQHTAGLESVIREYKMKENDKEKRDINPHDDYETIDNEGNLR